MINKYKIIDQIYNELRKKGYSYSETISWLRRRKALKGQSLYRDKKHNEITLIKLKDILREAKKERVIH